MSPRLKPRVDDRGRNALSLAILVAFVGCRGPAQHAGADAAATSTEPAPAASALLDAAAPEPVSSALGPAADAKPMAGLDEELEQRCSQEPAGGALSDKKWMEECTLYSWSLFESGNKLLRNDLEGAARLWRRAAQVTLPYAEPARKARMRLGELSLASSDGKLLAVCHFVAALSPRVLCHVELKDRLEKITRKTEKFPGCEKTLQCDEQASLRVLNTDVLDKAALGRLTTLACRQGLSGAKELWGSVPASTRPAQCQPD